MTNNETYPMHEDKIQKDMIGLETNIHMQRIQWV